MDIHQLKEEVEFENGAILSVMVDGGDTDFWETNRPEFRFFKDLEALESRIRIIPASEVKNTTKYSFLTAHNRRFS
jgi:hypothetical protein